MLSDLGSHGEVGDEGPLGDLDVEADALGRGGRVDHRAPDGGVGEARRDAALHPVALDGDVISTDGLGAEGTRTEGTFMSSPSHL